MSGSGLLCEFRTNDTPFLIWEIIILIWMRQYFGMAVGKAATSECYLLHSNNPGNDTY